MNLHELTAISHDETKAMELFEKLRWPNGPVCPHCKATDRIYRLQGKTTRAGLHKCGHCRKQFTARVGSIFEDSPLPIGKWLIAIYQMCSSKKGISAKQLERQLGVNYRTAWFMCHRVREAMKADPLRSMLGAGGGTVEVDETFVGGKVANNKHRNRTAAAGKKTIVMTLIDREGDARTFVVPNIKKKTLQTVARPNIDGSAHIITDENRSYDGMEKHFASHDTVDHSKTFVRSIIFHTNFAESYHSLLKRGIIGAFHHVSEKHLPRYLHEFEFRWNRRKLTDGERFEETFAGANGRRLMYRTPLIS